MTVNTSTTILGGRISAPRDRGGPRPISRVTWARLTSGERHEASADDGPGR